MMTTLLCVILLDVRWAVLKLYRSQEAKKKSPVWMGLMLFGDGGGGDDDDDDDCCIIAKD